jgi:hypothetical protein
MLTLVEIGCPKPTSFPVHVLNGRDVETRVTIHAAICGLCAMDTISGIPWPTFAVGIAEGANAFLLLPEQFARLEDSQSFWFMAVLRPCKPS